MEAFLKDYLALLRYEKNLSENTVNSYRTDISNFLEFVVEIKINDLNSVTSNVLIDFFELQRKRGIEGKTTARYMSSLKGFFRYLEDNSYIEKNLLKHLK